MLVPVWVVRVLRRGSPLVVAVLLRVLLRRGKGLRRCLRVSRFCGISSMLRLLSPGVRI